MPALWIILAILVLILIWGITAYNGFVRLRNDAEEAFSAIDVFLKKRFDLIPNLVETVKGYAKHESETLEKVVAARNASQNAGTTAEKIAADNQLTGTLKSLFAVAEAYPDLKANSDFMNLQNQLSSIENEIAGSRRYYNAIAKRLNTKTEVFPSSIVASLFHVEKKPLYEINEEQRENVKVQF